MRLAHEGPEGPTRAWPTLAQAGPEGPGPQDPRAFHKGLAHKGPASPQGPGPQGPSGAHKFLAHKGRPRGRPRSSRMFPSEMVILAFALTIGFWVPGEIRLFSF